MTVHLSSAVSAGRVRVCVCVCVCHICIDVKLPFTVFVKAGGGCMVWQSSTNEDTAFPW